MRASVPESRPVCLTIAGSDSGGGAGIQADIKTMEAMGVFATSAITATTAQNTQEVRSSHVLPVPDVAAQLRAVIDDISIAAIKTGMLATADILDCVTREVRSLDVPLVVDPVMVAASGDRLLTEEAEAAYDELIAEATIVTPNADEAEVLTSVELTDVDAQIAAGRELLGTGVDAALVKGGHIPGDPVTDVLVTEETIETFDHERIDTDATHGSGCLVASAIAAGLADGVNITEAVSVALGLAERAVRYPLAIGDGGGSVHHLVTLRNEAAKATTIDTIGDIVDTVIDADVDTLVPEVGMNIVGATPYAESPDDTAAVEGRIARTTRGVEPTGGIGIGASSHVARFLLAVREHDPAIRYAVNCRNDEDVRDSMASLGWSVASYDRAEQPAEIRKTEGSTMGWGASTAIEEAGDIPMAIVDPGAHGKEPMTKILARDPHALTDRICTLHEHLVRTD